MVFGMSFNCGMTKSFNMSCYIDTLILYSVKKKRSAVFLMIISPYLTFNMFNNKRCTNLRSCTHLLWTPFIYSMRKVTLYKSNKLNKIVVEFVQFPHDYWSNRVSVELIINDQKLICHIVDCCFKQRAFNLFWSLSSSSRCRGCVSRGRRVQGYALVSCLF